MIPAWKIGWIFQVTESSCLKVRIFVVEQMAN